VIVLETGSTAERARFVIIGALQAELDDDSSQEAGRNRELCAPAAALPAM
jgi:hypothetical protein